MAETIHLWYNSHLFEWDETKSKVNHSKHGISFLEAVKLWQDPQGIILHAKIVGKENRAMLIARYERKTWSSIYTVRGQKIRIISTRRARGNEEALYEKGK